MSRRILAIIVAIGLATLGTAGGLFLVLSADARAQARISDAVTVAVATARIPAGTSGATIAAQGLVRYEQMPRALVPADVVAEIDSDLAHLVVTSNVAAGQLLLQANFGERSVAMNGLGLPPGRMAITVSTGAPEQVAGYVSAGSQVAIFITYQLVDRNGVKSSIERTRVLLPRVEVLAVGTNSGEDDDAPRTRGGSLLVTVAVDQAEAERLIEGLNHGTLYLALLTDSVEVSVGAGVDNTDLGTGTVPLFK